MTKLFQGKMEEAVTFSQIIEGKSTHASWKLHNWKEHHSLLSAEADCRMENGDVKLRFYLKPLKMTVKLDVQSTIKSEWYSLCVQLVSPHEHVSLRVSVIEESFVRNIDSRVFLKRSASNQKAEEIVAAEFLLIGKWSVDKSTGADVPITNYWIPTHLNTDELSILITATLLELHQCEDPVIYEVPAEVGSGPCWKEALPANISKILEADERKLFSDVKLQMKDGVTCDAHKLVLAGSSSVFRNLFTGDMKESHKNIMAIRDVSSAEMKIILQFIYDRKIDPAWTGLVSEVLYTAKKYHVNGLLEYCDKMLIRICEPSNALLLLKLAKTYCLKTATRNLIEYSKIHAQEILMSQVANV